MINIVHKLNQHGSLLGAVLVTIIALSIIGLSLTAYVSSRYVSTNRSVYTSNALLSAEAGIEQTLYQLNQDDDFGGYTTEQTFFNNNSQGKGVFTTTVSDSADTNAKIITSVGRTYYQNNTTTPINSRTIKVTVVGTTSGGYSVFTGPGGLILGGSANITNSDVFVQGYITMSGSARIGTVSNPLTVNVAHKRCPSGPNPGATYPQVCTTGQPINISGSAAIYGSVCATGQSNSNRIFAGNGGQGLINGCVGDPNTTQPEYNRTAHIARMNPLAGYASNNPTYTCGGSQTKTWPANLRLNGNVSIGASCRLTINGDVYITGNLDIGGSARISVAPGLTTRPVIVVDGTITTGGSGALMANSTGTGLHLISFKSAGACGATCTNLTGTDLYNSQNQTTLNVGGSSSLAGMVFQAYWGKAVIGGSGNIGAVTGQTVDLSGSGTITFGTILSSGNRSWTISSYQRQF